MPSSKSPEKSKGKTALPAKAKSHKKPAGKPAGPDPAFESTLRQLTGALERAVVSAQPVVLHLPGDHYVFACDVRSVTCGADDDGTQYVSIERRDGAVVKCVGFHDRESARAVAAGVADHMGRVHCLVHEAALPAAHAEGVPSEEENDVVDGTPA